jgi:8-oxo-dGTP pyrophosphatase MutT (NUDIX family)
MSYQHADSISCKVLIRDSEDRTAAWLVHYTREQRYGLPGGRAEEGEAFEAAAQREVLEEIGAEVGNLQLATAWLMSNDERRQGQDCLILLFTADLVKFTHNKMSPEGELPVKIALADIDSVEGLRDSYKQAIHRSIAKEHEHVVPGTR